MNDILTRQLAIDFCTDVDSVLSKENIFTEYKRIEGRRIFQERECFLKVAVVNGKILASGKKNIIEWVRDKYKNGNGAWFMDMECLHELEEGLSKRHDFMHIVGTEMEVDEKGNYTGKVDGECVAGDEKIKRLYNYADEHFGKDN